MSRHPTSRALISAGVLLMLACGLIHLIGAPEHLQEATYIGVLFVINAAGALVATLGIYRDRLWGWLLGILVAGGAFVMFVVSRLIGLPAYEEHVGMWLGESAGDRLGIPSLFVEATLVALSLIVLARRARGRVGNQRGKGGNSHEGTIEEAFHSRSDLAKRPREEGGVKR